MDTLTVYAVMNEGHPIAGVTPDNEGIVVCTSMWETEQEAQHCINRVFDKSFGTWKPKRRWIESREIGYDDLDKVSVLAHNGPEYSTPLR